MKTVYRTLTRVPFVRSFEDLRNLELWRFFELWLVFVGYLLLHNRISIEFIDFSLRDKE